ncbi:helix-turn-helix domain-containing protein [Gemmobacter lanyuensis]|uniref:AraC-like ligand-binding domain-containing protein n=1 Tax=Gemmobacter lanyuensis TaxID=1054497 RepID=UPI00167706B6|nr:helix-turn-helix domain-containing protein [Gemmobacter lanyuensis]
MPGLPARRAGLDGSDPWARFEEWRRALDSLFDCAPVEETPAAFHGELVGYQLDPVLLGASRASAQRFHRDEARIAAAGVDHLLIQLYQSGRCAFDADGHAAEGRAGDIVCFDLSRPMTSVTSDLETVSLVVPRQMLRLAPRALDGLHGAVLDGGSAMGRLLSDHLRSLLSVAPGMNAADSRLVCEATAGLLSAGLASAAGASAVPEILIAPNVQAVQRFIEMNLTNFDLSAEMVMKRFGLSRSALYRLFEPLGGVAEYIRQRRLSRAALRIGSVGRGRGAVARLAHLSGFASEAAFTRAFRSRYGIAPRAVLQDPQGAGGWHGGRGPAVDDWLHAWMAGLSAAVR